MMLNGEFGEEWNSQSSWKLQIQLGIDKWCFLVLEGLGLFVREFSYNWILVTFHLISFSFLSLEDPRSLYVHRTELCCWRSYLLILVFPVGCETAHIILKWHFTSLRGSYTTRKLASLIVSNHLNHNIGFWFCCRVGLAFCPDLSCISSQGNSSTRIIVPLTQKSM